MPWVTEQEQKDLSERIEETRDWIEKKMEAQEKLALTEDPAFTIEQLNQKMELLSKLAKKVFGKKKPYEKPKKVTKVDVDEESKDEEKTDDNKSKDEDKTENNTDDKTKKEEQENKQEKSEEL